MTKGQVCRFIEWSNAAVVDDEGIVQLLVGTGIDMTEKVEAQQRAIELEVQQAKAHELAEFVRGMSHDIRTPLATLMSWSYLIKQRNHQSELTESMETVQRQINYLADVIDDIQLVVDLIDSSALDDLKPFNLNRMIEELCMAFADRIAAKKLNLRLNLLQDLPEAIGDQPLLFRAVKNVFDNAIRYTPDQGDITLRTGWDDEMIVVEVSDSGVGIGTEDLPHIFEYFYKGDKARTSRGAGCGLGLTIAKHVIQSHHGWIEVESTRGQGSRFCLMLPGRSR